ncbi:MAG: transposase [Butyrivibrio sp.]|nr:transposase [Ruminococcus flavefaciens]MCM1561567.1 transposase [Butyrivibrio sp.]
MLESCTSVRRIVLACGTVDLREGIDGLAMIIGDRYKQDPFEKGTGLTASKAYFGWGQGSEL